jgi:hypothetical protein
MMSNNQRSADNKIDKLFGPAGSFTGLSMAVFSVVAFIYGSAVTGIVLLIAGLFMAFTFSGTIIDYRKRRIKSYTCLFGFLNIGKWTDINEFSRFTISRSRRTYTALSRANVPLTLKTCDIRLKLLNKTGSLQVTVGKYDSFESARNAMTRLISDLELTGMAEWK